MTGAQKQKLRDLHERTRLAYALTEGHVECLILQAKIDTLVMLAEIFGVTL